MGRLDIRIRHGGGGDGQWPAVIALLVFILLAAAGGAGHKALAGAVHDIETGVEIAAWTVGGLVIVAVVTVAVLFGLRVRKAVRAARARRAVTRPVITITPLSPAPRLPGTDRPALGAPRDSRNWPLPGWWEEIRPGIGGDDDEHRR